MSYNLWIYSFVNPLKYVDPSGMVPTEAEIVQGRHVYSCNCGWIDFAHANPGNSKDIFKLLNSKPALPTGINVRQDVLLLTMRMYFPLHIQVQENVVVRTNLDENLKKEVALGMYMAREELREGIQAVSPWAHTSYSEEDLVSDLIGFYMGVNGYKSAKSDVDSWRWLAETCGFPEDEEEAKEWSLEVFRNYPAFKQVKEWGNPRLECSSVIDKECTDRREWPAVFSTITPKMPKVDGYWWLYRGWHTDGIFLATDIEDVYFLYRGD